MFRLLYYLYFQSICDSGQQGCEPGGPNQTGSRAAQILHERDGMISISQTEKRGSHRRDRGEDKTVMNGMNLAAVQLLSE